MSSSLATDRLTTAFDVLADPRRRYMLSILEDCTGPLPLERLAVDVAVSEHGSPIVTDEQSQVAYIELVHHHVPRLIDIGLLTEDADGDDDTRTVALADHPILEREWVWHLLENPTGGASSDERSVTRLLEALQPTRRRLACAVLARQRDTLDVTDLAVMVAARGDGTRLVDVTEADWQPVTTRLVHNDLPALADAGLVEYDPSSTTVSIAADAPAWRAEWLTMSPLGEITARLEPSRVRTGTGAAGLGSDDTTEVDPTGAGTCWTVNGTKSVAVRGHQLADSAEDELFVTVPDASMIQRRCLERWRAAADRGVDVYVGSGSPRVRDTVRSAVPEATICKPRFDWLNFPVEAVHHGRVVFADRERVMLVTVDDADGNRETTAITAEGPANALVRLVREHVGPRLDRLESRVSDADTSDGQATPHPL